MSLFFNREFDKIKKELLAMGAMAEKNLHQAVLAALRHDAELARQVMAADKEVDAREVEVEEEILKVLALYQPVAQDLRMMVAMLKINHDLERIGDLAKDIGKRALNLAGRAPAELGCPLEDLGIKAQAMVKESLDSLIQNDAELARKVWRDDDAVDEIHEQCLNVLVSKLPEAGEQAASLVDYGWISGHLERIGDHAANIAKNVLYLTTGEIVRHRGRIFKNPPAS